MSPPPAGVLKPKLWREAREAVKSRYKTWPSALASAQIAKEYKEMGGTFSERRKENVGLNRWFQEEWVQVTPYVTKGKKVPCGADETSKACRPLHRKSKNTPPTLTESIEHLGAEKVLRLAREKRKDMRSRVDWKRGTVRLGGGKGKAK